MHQSRVDALMAGTSQDMEWPPRSEAQRWSKIREFKRRYASSAADSFRYRPDLHRFDDAAATAAAAANFVSVPIVRDMARLSASMLFSEPPKITAVGDAEQTAVDLFSEENRLDARLYAAAVQVAATGSVGIRILRDDLTSQYPIVTFEDGDNVIWATKYGHVVQGGVLVVTFSEDSSTVYRMLERHEPGRVTRKLYKGTLSRLGKPIPLASGPQEFRDLKDEVSTGLTDTATLIRWSNDPTAQPDGAGAESLLDLLDESASIGREKLRASRATTFIHHSLAEDTGDGGINLPGAVLIGRSGTSSPLDEPRQMVDHVNPGIGAEDHVRYVEHVREQIISFCGYSLASYGLERGGTADSGTALRLRQSKSLSTRKAKERMAREAIAETAGVATALMLGRSEAGPLNPEVELGDGLPVDTMELASELDTLRRAGIISEEEAIRQLRPEWPEERVEEELALIRNGTRRQNVLDSLNTLGA